MRSSLFLTNDFRDSDSSISDFSASYRKAWPFLVRVLFLLSCWIFTCARAQAANSPQVVYKTAASVVALSREGATHGGLANINGTVTLSSPRGIVLNDGTAGVWVEWGNGTKGTFAVGDVLTVRGTIGPGAYSPEIENATVQRNGKGILPRPKAVSFMDLQSGNEDAQYVEIKGTIRSVTLRGDALKTVPEVGVLLTLDMPDGHVDVALPTAYYESASKMIDSDVRIIATALVRKNDDQQQIGVLLMAPDINRIRILRAGTRDLFGAPLAPIASLLQWGSKTDYFHRVRIRGTLTYYEQGKRFILQDETRAIEVVPADSPHLNVGDRVEAVGFPAPDVAGPSLHDAVARRIGTGLPLTPTSVSLHEALASKSRSSLISLHLRLVRVIREPGRTKFLLEAGHDVTSAELNKTVTIPAWLRPGSDLMLTGINMLSVEGGADYLNYNDATAHSVLLLRSLNDITLLSPASWWTQGHLFYLSVALAILLASIFVLLMYVQLKRWKVESMFKERERLARDVHDTLAQSFAGVGFQLQVIRRAAVKNDLQLLRHIDTARELVQFSHREARKSLIPESREDSVGPDLLISLHEKAQTLMRNSHVKLEADSSGTSRPIPRDVKAQLFQIGQEAIANALRHADPTTLSIMIEYNTDSIRLVVSDDGRGFTTDGNPLGFGLRGMRKRASELGADFDLSSTPGTGTTVTVSVQTGTRRNLLWTRTITGRRLPQGNSACNQEL